MSKTRNNNFNTTEEPEATPEATTEETNTTTEEVKTTPKVGTKETKTASEKPEISYEVRTICKLNVRSEPSCYSEILKVFNSGTTCRIIDEIEGAGPKLDDRTTLWGKLESEPGWIMLPYTLRT